MKQQYDWADAIHAAYKQIEKCEDKESREIALNELEEFLIKLRYGIS